MHGPVLPGPSPPAPLCGRDHLVIEDLEELLPSEKDAKSAMVRTDRGGGGGQLAAATANRTTACNHALSGHAASEGPTPHYASLRLVCPDCPPHPPRPTLPSALCPPMQDMLDEDSNGKVTVQVGGGVPAPPAHFACQSCRLL